MNERESFRSAVGSLIDRYLALKRGLGRRYALEGNVLRSLDALLASALPMGHVSIVSRQYYLQFVEPLAASASSRFAHHCGGLVTAAPQKKGPDR